MFDAEITIIGAGVVGLAIAEELSNKYDNIFVIEKHITFGQETSSRNSEVIHAGIYYPNKSLKAKLCVRGNRLLYDYCDRYGISYNNCGKLIVATSQDELTALDELLQKAKDNDVASIYPISIDVIKQKEPQIKAEGALYSPSTGVVDSHGLMKQLETNAVNKGVQFAYGSEVKGITKLNEGYEIQLLDADAQDYSFSTRKVVNSAGLESENISRMVGIFDNSLKISFCKGEYFRINPPKNKLVKHLIYPVPNPNTEGLGVHVTIDLGGGVKLGPDVTWMDQNIYDYKTTPDKQKEFYQSAKRFLPFLELDDISPEMAGIRPKLQVPGGPVRDFYIADETQKGYPGFINLLGIESPGLTSSLAIAEYVLSLV